MPSERELRHQIVSTARALHARGWVANHDGNVTARLDRGRFLATPTATSKADVDDGNLLVVDAGGARLSGTARPFSELSMHLAVYEHRDDVHAVVHAHPPHATAIACSDSAVLERPFIAEAVVSIGPSIPTVPFAAPGAAARDALVPHLPRVDAVLLANHGVFAWGATVEQAYLRLELVEHLARIALAAQAVGGVRPLPESAIPPLLAARARANLGKAADGAAPEAGPRRVVACAPPPPGSDVEVVEPRAPSELARLIREELLRALAERG